MEASSHLSHTVLSQTPDFENYAKGRRSRCQQHSSSSSTVEFVDNYAYTTIDESRLFTTNCNPLTPLLRFVVQLVSTVDNISTDMARRGSRVSCFRRLVTKSDQLLTAKTARNRSNIKRPENTFDFNILRLLKDLVTSLLDH